MLIPLPRCIPKRNENRDSKRYLSQVLMCNCQRKQPTCPLMDEWINKM